VIRRILAIILLSLALFLCGCVSFSAEKINETEKVVEDVKDIVEKLVRVGSEIYSHGNGTTR